MTGFSQLWLIAKKKIKIDGDIIAEGYRSDYYVPYAPDHSFEKTLQAMRSRVRDFDPNRYLAKGIIQNHLDETVQWGEKDELLYRCFKYDFRKSLSPAMKEYGISKDEIYEFLDRLPETCTIGTHYYPDTLSAYDPYLFMFKTDYEDFIIDLFSQLPASSSFFKVSNKLFVVAYIPEKFARTPSLRTASNKLQIPLLIIELLNKEIITFQNYAIVEYSWAKDL